MLLFSAMCGTLISYNVYNKIHEKNVDVRLSGLILSVGSVLVTLFFMIYQIQNNDCLTEFSEAKCDADISLRAVITISVYAGSIGIVMLIYGLGLLEKNLEKKLENFRKRSKNYLYPSFDTIAGSGPNGSIIHYKSNTQTNRKIKKNDILFWKGHVAIALNKKECVHAYGPAKKVVKIKINRLISKLTKKSLELSSIKRPL